MPRVKRSAPQHNFDPSGDDYDSDESIRWLKQDEAAMAVLELSSDEMRDFVAQKPVTPNALLIAVHYGYVDNLKVILDSGFDPSTRAPTSRQAYPVIAPGWKQTREHLRWAIDARAWMPLQEVAYSKRQFEGDPDPPLHELMSALLQHGAGKTLFEVYLQPLNEPSFSVYPGERADEPDNGLLDSSTSTTLPEYFNSELWNVPWLGKYAAGERTVLHALLEDGAYVKPILESLRASDLERRDPLGRTLLLSACRSGLGADVNYEAAMGTLADGQLVQQAFECGPSLFEYLRSKGADILATDDQGKTVLHHLLECDDNSHLGAQVGRISKTFASVIADHPELIEKPDKLGNYPIHTALQRIRRRAPGSTASMDYAAELRTLLAAGADASVRDAFGNNALHYLLDDGAGLPIELQAHLQLVRDLVARGVDIDARNNNGSTPLQLLQRTAHDEEGYREFGDVTGRAHQALLAEARQLSCPESS